MVRWFALIVLAMLGACSTGPRVNSDFDQTADFARYRTYDWVRDTPSGGPNPLLEQRIRAVIDATLARRGFARNRASPDFAIDITLGARDRIETTDFGPYAPFYPGFGSAYGRGWHYAYSPVEVRSFTEGTLAVDIYDAATRRPVWHGRAAKNIVPGRISDAELDEAVDAVLARFPPAVAR